MSSEVQPINPSTIGPLAQMKGMVRKSFEFPKGLITFRESKKCLNQMSSRKTPMEESYVSQNVVFEILQYDCHQIQLLYGLYKHIINTFSNYNIRYTEN